MKQQFIGIKILRSAELMTRAHYCDMRGWNVPENEDPTEAIYLVEYEVEPGQAPNLDGYEGYVSMSPKAVFEKAYLRLDTSWTPMNLGQEHEIRVQEEATELSSKLVSLNHFIDKSGIFQILDESDKILMRQQVSAMIAYLSILNARMLKFVSQLLE